MKSIGAGLSKEERETCILWNDAGDLTVWTSSSVWAKRLAKILPASKKALGDKWYLSLTEWSVTPRRKRVGSPRPHLLMGKRGGKSVG